MTSHITVTIYHNPKCGTSRNTLNLIKERGIDPEVILYLETPPSRAQLMQLLDKQAMKPRELLRTKADPYKELGLERDEFSDDQLVDFMVEHPILIERPVVVTSLGARLCRPYDKVLEILP